jgi:hypothetical protein
MDEGPLALRRPIHTSVKHRENQHHIGFAAPKQVHIEAKWLDFLRAHTNLRRHCALMAASKTDADSPDSAKCLSVLHVNGK